MLYATEKRRAVTAILLVFMFIFAELLVANNDYTEMEEMEEDYYTVTQPSIATETHISSDFSSINYQTSTHSFIGLDSVGNEDRSLYRFTNSFNKQTDMIHSAELVLTCDVLYQQDSSVLPKLFPATIVSNIAPSEVTWNEIANGVSWQ
ncbi:MAG: hypothetical protein CL988_05555, partial [Euryarchaeota archaeon]|nr:hypothetical protein [Euryarchaeota archaeon]